MPVGKWWAGEMWSTSASPAFTIQEQDAGLHFLLQVDTPLSDAQLEDFFLRQGLKIQPLGSFYREPRDLRTLVVNYSGVDEAALENALKKLERIE